jgi:hypothetical protein
VPYRVRVPIGALAVVWGFVGYVQWIAVTVISNRFGLGSVISLGLWVGPYAMFVLSAFVVWLPRWVRYLWRNRPRRVWVPVTDDLRSYPDASR